MRRYKDRFSAFSPWLPGREFGGDFEEPRLKWCINISVAADGHNLRFRFPTCITSGNTQEQEQCQPAICLFISFSYRSLRNRCKSQILLQSERPLGIQCKCTCPAFLPLRTYR